VVAGEVKERHLARQIYEAAREQGFVASLLEQERPNIFTQSVANLEPGRRVTVRIRTVETLRYEKGTYGFTFPLVVGPRYIPTPAVPDADKITPPYLRPHLRSGHDVEIEVRLEAGVAIQDLSSPSHRILNERPTATSALVRLAPGDTIPNKDFMLRWNVSSERPAVGLLTHRDGVDGFFTMLVQPKGEVTAQEAAPKEIILVMDTSGSMSGIPIESSKRFVKMALGSLGPRDTFNLIRFAGSAETFSAEPLPNDDASIRRAVKWVKKLTGGGGTEMLTGFRAAFARPADPDRMRMVVFLTDGYIGNDSQILEAVGAVVGDARIFSLGIGSSVNHYLLDRMAELGRGAYVFIRPDGREAQAVERFRSWVTRPYLTDLEVDWGALPVADLVPDRPRDLFSGQTLTIVGRYLGAGEGEVVVRGKLGGRHWEQRQHVVLPHREESNAALASLWARHRIAALMLTSPGRILESVRAEVTTLALAHRLMSPFTSFVAVDDSFVVNPDGESETIHQALPVPEGVSFEGVFGAKGPRALQIVQTEILPEDSREQEVPVVDRSDLVTIARHASNVDPLSGLRLSNVNVDSIEEVEAVTVHAGAEFGRAQGGFANAVPASGAGDRKSFGDEFVQDLPVQGRHYTNVLTLAPGLQDSDGDGNPNVHGARERDFATKTLGYIASASKREVTGPLPTMAAYHLLDAALRLLADLAEDGRLSPSEGRPALAALLAAQTPEGAVAHDVRVQAISTWALAEAAAALPEDPWVEAASGKAIAYLAGLAGKDGWPARPGGEMHAESTWWARLVTLWILKEKSPTIPVPAGEASVEYTRLRKALAAANSGDSIGKPPGRQPFDRLLVAVGRGHLKLST